MIKILLCFFCFAGLAASAQQVPTPQAPPSTEIYLFDISYKKNQVTIAKPVNITNHKGYDNQPSFHPDDPVVYYTSAGEDGRTDIVSYDFKSKMTKPVTKTPDKEYSPTVTLDKHHLSCIIQRDNGDQDLGKYTLIGDEPSVIIDNMTVGYHVWADNSHLGLFVLGTPNTLHYIRLPTKKDTIVAQNIGRSLHKVPNESAISFVAKLSNEEWMIRKLNTQTMAISDVVPAITNHEDYCWLPDGRLLTSDGPKLFFAVPSDGPGWNEVVVGSGKDVLRNVTRLAVSPDGKKLAVVVAE